jgi:7-keto-8-aminopelargonate synthetase-like enzyme
VDDGWRRNDYKIPEADNQEIDDLVDEWQPVPLVDGNTDFDEGTLDSVPLIQGPNGLKVKIQPNGKTLTNLATPNWTGLIENESMKQVAVDTVRGYGVGTCGPSGFYGTIGESSLHSSFIVIWCFTILIYRQVYPSRL